MNRVLHMLLVDDNPDDRSLIIRELSEGFPDCQFSQVTDARQLALALERGPWDLVVTDYQLRWSDGLRVLLSVKSRWPECPVIMFTGTGSEEIAVQAMKSGLDDYVLKSPKHYARLPAAAKFVDAAGAKTALDVWLGWWRDALLVQQGCADLVANADRLEPLRRLGAAQPTAQVWRAMARVQETRQQLDANANVRLAMEALLLDLPEQPSA